MNQKKVTFSEIFEIHGGKCVYCDEDLKASFNAFWSSQRDRLIPGGPYTPENVVLACAPCNNLRGNYAPMEMTLTADNREEYLGAIKRYVLKRREEKRSSDYASWIAEIEGNEAPVTLKEQEETVHEGKWLRMKRRGQWEYCERTHGRDGMAVIIVAVTPQDEVLFVEQYRVPLGARTIEMPAGLVGDLVHGDGMEDTLERAAQRELAEETGWHPEKVDVLLIGPTSSGMSSERIAFVRATGLVRVGDGGGVDGEDITVHAVPRAEAPAWLMRKQREGYELDLKLWGGLWMIDRNPDGSPAA